jgi:hypothetical protein
MGFLSFLTENYKRCKNSPSPSVLMASDASFMVFHSQYNILTIIFSPNLLKKMNFPHLHSKLAWMENLITKQQLELN